MGEEHSKLDSCERPFVGSPENVKLYHEKSNRKVSETPFPLDKIFPRRRLKTDGRELCGFFKRLRRRSLSHIRNTKGLARRPLESFSNIGIQSQRNVCHKLTCAAQCIEVLSRIGSLVGFVRTPFVSSHVGHTCSVGSGANARNLKKKGLFCASLLNH